MRSRSTNINVTKCFGSTGRFQFKFLSALPGGGGVRSSDSPDKITVLDCVFSEKLKTFFILDAITWNGVPVYTYETECRFFFLKSRFEELPPPRADVQTKYNFHLLDYLECDSSVIHTKMNNLLRIDEEEILYDGVVFYHKNSQYVFRPTPLALWLRGFMIPEVLNIDIHPTYTQLIPKNYENMTSYLSRKWRKQCKLQYKKASQMDTS